MIQGFTGDFYFFESIISCSISFRSAYSVTKIFMEAMILSQGTLQFRVYASNAWIPIEDATVVVSTEGRNPEILGVRTTNESGQAGPITISTPASALSQEPNPSQRPYTSVKVIAEHPDFERVTLEGIQVFPGIASELSIQMVPLLEFDPEKNHSIHINIPSQTL